MDESKKSMPAVKTQDSERGFIENFADGVVKIFDNAVLFCDEHSTLIKYGVGAIAALATLPLTPIASAVVGVVAAVAVDQAQGAIHKKADIIRLKHQERVSILPDGKDSEHSKELEPSKANQEEYEPLNEGRHPILSSPKYTAHHADKALAEKAAHQAKGNNGEAHAA